MAFMTNQASHVEGGKHKYACCDPDSDEYDAEECRRKKAGKAKDAAPRHHFDAQLILDKGEAAHHRRWLPRGDRPRRPHWHPDLPGP